MQSKLTGSGLTSIGTGPLLDELCARVMRLERAALRLRSVGHLREVARRALTAGQSTGRGEQLEAVALGLKQLLDEATAAMPDVPPDGFGDNTPALNYWRSGRQHLWRRLEQMREQYLALAHTEQTAANAERRYVEQRVVEVEREAADAASLRIRLGRWLYTLGVRLTERQGAA